jgi:hypothetical protein
MALTKVHTRMIEGDSVSVKDYGATGDGVTDDVVAIQAAMDSGASDIYFPNGTYLVSTPLYAKSAHTQNLTIRGEGRTNTYIAPMAVDISDATVNINAIFINQHNNGKLSFSNIRFWSGVGFTGNAIYAKEGGGDDGSCQAVFSGSIQDCWFSLANTNGGYFKGALNNYFVTNNVFEGAKSCFILKGIGNADIHFKSNTVYNCYDQFIDASQDTNAKNHITIAGIHQYGTFRGSLIKADNANQWNISDINVQADNASATDIGLFDFKDSDHINVNNFIIKSASSGTIANAIILEGTTAKFSNGFISGAAEGIQLKGTAIVNLTFSSVTIKDSTTHAFCNHEDLTAGDIYINNCDWSNSEGSSYVDTVAGAYNLTINNSRFLNAGYPSGSAGNRTLALSTSGNVNLYNCEIGRDDATAAASYYINANGSGDLVLTNCRYTSMAAPIGNTLGTQDVLYAGGIGELYRQYYATAAPTSGTWNKGDSVMNGNPSAGGTAGWICVTAGTPGTWKTFGTISA